MSTDKVRAGLNANQILFRNIFQDGEEYDTLGSNNNLMEEGRAPLYATISSEQRSYKTTTATSERVNVYGAL